MRKVVVVAILLTMMGDATAQIRYGPPFMKSPILSLPTCLCFAIDGTYGIDTHACPPVETISGGGPGAPTCEQAVFDQSGAAVEMGMIRNCFSGGQMLWYLVGTDGLTQPNCYSLTGGGEVTQQGITQQQEDDCKAVLAASVKYSTNCVP